MKGAYSNSATVEFPVLNLPHVALVHAGVCECVCVCVCGQLYFLFSFNGIRERSGALEPKIWL